MKIANVYAGFMHVGRVNLRECSAKLECAGRNFVGGEVEVSNIGVKRPPGSKQLAAMDSESHMEAGGRHSKTLQGPPRRDECLGLFAHGPARE